jgi:predicted nucleic acid-binding protein
MFLIDTCVLSELSKPQPEKAVVNWFEAHKHATMFISSMVVLELVRGIMRLPVGQKRAILEHWLVQTRKHYADCVLPVSTDVAEVAAQLMVKLEKQGQQILLPDALIAATALSHQLILVTRNSKDFLHTDVLLLNPWHSSTQVVS